MEGPLEVDLGFVLLSSWNVLIGPLMLIPFFGPVTTVLFIMLPEFTKLVGIDLPSLQLINRLLMHLR